MKLLIANSNISGNGGGVTGIVVKESDYGFIISSSISTFIWSMFVLFYVPMYLCT